ncbi:MAG: glycosyltransferase family 2 protein [Candidatus Syntrophonatronum acetioxidans]|uniref:Glycosyltransferase family 2 protein n=1 Tax=Candidatus Syntrophonatronum acetioxidans TaxID=1795816 RepID=A0A424YCF0_9FIRM|nr:MAG: glycosyltransferase family 2 protein [Candidatus Syntrophonatronum acetioxidans]
MEIISVIIPAYNEEDRIGATINSLNKIKEVGEILVINDGSRDKTGEIAAEYGVKVINLPKNRGKAGAVMEGVMRAKNDLVAVVDADLGDI